jgi:hypothetical protein
MGGALGLDTRYGRGNITPAAECNVWFDPQAAETSWVEDSGQLSKSALIGFRAFFWSHFYSSISARSKIDLESKSA